MPPYQGPLSVPPKILNERKSLITTMSSSTTLGNEGNTQDGHINPDSQCASDARPEVIDVLNDMIARVCNTTLPFGDSSVGRSVLAENGIIGKASSEHSK